MPLGNEIGNETGNDPIIARPNQQPFDLDIISVSGPYTDMDTQCSTLVFGSVDFIHVSLSAQSTSGDAYDLTNAKVEFLVGDLLTGTWQAAEWITNAEKSIYAVLLVAANDLMSGAGNWPSSLWYMVWVRVTVNDAVKIKRVGRLLLLTS